MSAKRLIDSVVKCLKCGAKGIGTCDCWTTCEHCGWMYETGGQCRNCGQKRGTPPRHAKPAHVREYWERNKGRLKSE